MHPLIQVALVAQLALPAAPLPPIAPLAPLPALPVLASLDVTLPSPAWPATDATDFTGFGAAQAPDDPADSLLRAASDRMARGDYRAAADMYHSVLRRYPSSGRLSEAMYYESFALYRAGEFAKARGALDALRERFPQAAARGDANTLRARVCGELARQGDSDCAEEVTRLSASASGGSAGAGASGGSSARGGRRSGRNASCPGDEDDDDENDTRVAALNALLQMDAERAMPILTNVLARRDACSERLRRRAVFLVAQKQSRESANILLAAAKNDPDPEVREQAVFWLSQVRDPRAVQMLLDIVNGDGERGVREKALFALSQHSSPEAAAALRGFAENEREPAELRERAIFAIAQRSGADQGEYLRTLYRRLGSEELKEKVLFGLAMRRNGDNAAFLLGIARDSREPLELRKKAIFHAGTNGAMTGEQLGTLYTSLTERELREQVVFALSQRRDAGSLDRLMDIARSDPDRELRKKAIFWLGQSRDPRVTAFLAELISK